MDVKPFFNLATDLLIFWFGVAIFFAGFGAVKDGDAGFKKVVKVLATESEPWFRIFLVILVVWMTFGYFTV